MIETTSSKISHTLALGMSILVPVALLVAMPAKTPADDSAATRASHHAETSLNDRGVTAAQEGRYEAGILLLREAVALEPDDRQVRTNLSGVLTDWATRLEQRGDVDQALVALQEAVEHAPENGAALVRLGDLFYATQDDFAQAIRSWKSAHGKIPTTHWQAVAQRITQAERDLRIERTFTALATPHFQIRFDGPQHAEEAAMLGEAIEREYARLAHAMGTAPERLTAIVYTGEDFQRIVGRRDWALGLYDGRIRLRLDEVDTPRTAQILAHELAHAFLSELYGPQLPIWVHEGFAQAQEPSHPLTDQQQRILRGVTSGTLWVPLKWLDRRFEQPSGRDDIERAYMQSRWVVETLLERHGMDRFQAWLDKLTQGEPIDQAFDHAFAPARWAQADHGTLE